jgi:hypothetical protein
MAVKPFLTTGIALASAAAIVAGTPTVLPAGATTVTASAPAPTALSHAKYELTALSDISLNGIINAWNNGWGDYIGGQFDEGEVVLGDEIQTDPYFPGLNPGTPVFGADGTTIVGYSYNNNPIFLSGIPGALYYLADNILPGNIDNYYFEAGGLPAAIYVAANEVFGAGSPAAVAAGLIFQTPPGALISAAIVGVASLTPVIHIGNLTIGGGILANQYVSGGVPAVINYIVNALTNPPAAAAAAAALEKKALTAKSDAKVEAAAADNTDPTDPDTTGTDTTVNTKTPKTGKFKSNPLAELAASVTDTLNPAKVNDAKKFAKGLTKTQNVTPPAGDNTAPTGTGTGTDGSNAGGAGKDGSSKGSSSKSGSKAGHAAHAKSKSHSNN